ncbi:hypothetical protein KP509_07G079900 [Ceratopteris richardii]|nr:hypothetical protein KP509_07G079900 [Ceratopteris richardii]
MLPTCGHLFHISCIDMWSQSHTNCHVCRQNPTLPLIQKFLSCLDFHCSEDQGINDSPADNGGFLALAGVENAMDVPSASGESYHAVCTSSVLEKPAHQLLSVAPLCNLTTENHTMHFQMDGCRVLDVQGLPQRVE